MFRKIAAGVSALAMVATPVAASAAPNPASSLSVASSVRAGATGGSSQLGGGNSGPIVGGIIGLGILIGAAFLISDKEDDDSDSR